MTVIPEAPAGTCDRSAACGVFDGAEAFTLLGSAAFAGTAPGLARVAVFFRGAAGRTGATAGDGVSRAGVAGESVEAELVAGDGVNRGTAAAIGR